MSEDQDKGLFSFFRKKEEGNPIKDARQMADQFQEDLEGRLEVIVGEHDSQFIKYSIQPYRTEESGDAGVSIRIYAEVDKLKLPMNTTQQIHNAVWGSENMLKLKPEIRTLTDTIEEYYQSGGKVKNIDKSGNLTTQKNYKFSAK